ncbi:hypothetical protein HY632_01470 [Candidatus Uhrbacteria bacterium]|nr:hypothetical protein [Candidatus Uhrbacteria bacterium]
MRERDALVDLLIALRQRRVTREMTDYPATELLVSALLEHAELSALAMRAADEREARARTGGEPDLSRVIDQLLRPPPVRASFGPADPRVREIMRYACLVHASSDVQEFAMVSGRTTAGLVAAIRRKELYAFPYGGVTRIPHFQLTAHRAIPGWSTVAPAIPDQLDPLTITTFFLLPHEGLCDARNQMPLSPRAFLCAKGDPARVRALVAMLGKNP